MKSLNKVISKIEAELDEKDQVREIALKSSRAVVRLSGSILRGLHRGDKVDTELEVVRDEASRLSSLLADHPELQSAGYVESAFQEFAEVGIIISILEHDDVPTPENIGVGSVPYILGLGDVVGELRRFCLSELKGGNVAKANHYLELMEDIFAALMRFDYPDAIVAVRRKQDVARSMLEKTRGEVAVATSAKNLQETLEAAMKKG